MRHLLAILLMVGLAFSLDILPPGGVSLIKPNLVNFSTYSISEIASGQVREGEVWDVVGIEYSENELILATNSRINREDVNRLYALGINGKKVEEKDSFTIPVQTEVHASSLLFSGSTWHLLSYVNQGPNRTCIIYNSERDAGRFIPSGSQQLITTGNDFWCEDFVKSASGFFLVGKRFAPELRGYIPFVSDTRLHEYSREGIGQFRSVVPLNQDRTLFVAAGEQDDRFTYKGLLEVYQSDARGVFPIAQSLMLNQGGETGLKDVATLNDGKTIFVTGDYEAGIPHYDQGLLRAYTFENDVLSFAHEFDFNSLSYNITAPEALVVGDVDNDGIEDVVVFASAIDFGAFDPIRERYSVSKKSAGVFVFDEDLSLKGSKLFALAGDDFVRDAKVLIADVDADGQNEIITAWNNDSAQIKILKAPRIDAVPPVIEVVEPSNQVEVGDVSVVVLATDASAISKVWVEVGSINKTLVKENNQYSTILQFNEARIQTLNIFAKDSKGNLARLEYHVEVLAPEEPIAEPPLVQPPVVEQNVSNVSQDNVTPSVGSSQELNDAIRELEIKIGVLKSQGKSFASVQEALLNAYKSKSEGNVEQALSQVQAGISNADVLLNASQVEPVQPVKKDDQMPLYLAGILVIGVIAAAGYLLMRKK